LQADDHGGGGTSPRHDLELDLRPRTRPT
jgi:hypothetical protein